MVEITQADREAAALTAEYQHKPQVARQIREGKADENWRVQAFARHRFTSTDPLMGEVRDGLRRISDMCPATCDMSVAHEMAAEADALLAKIEEPKG